MMLRYWTKLIVYWRITSANSCKLSSRDCLNNGKPFCSVPQSLILSNKSNRSLNVSRSSSMEISCKNEQRFSCQTLMEAALLLSHQPVEKLDQYYMLVPSNVKDAYLFHLLSLYHGNNDDDDDEEKKKTKKFSKSTIVFTNTCRDCQILSMMCRKFQMPSVEIHSLMKQRQRLASLAKFKSLQVPILFATDVASRYGDHCVLLYGPCLDFHSSEV